MLRFLLILMFCQYSIILFTQPLPLSNHIVLNARNFNFLKYQFNKSDLKFSSFIKNIEIRTEVNDFELERQKYSLRTSFFKKTNKQNQTLRLLNTKNQAILDLKSFFSTKLEFIYKFYIKNHFINSKKQLYIKLVAYLKDTKSVLGKQIVQYPIKIKDYLEIANQLDSYNSMIQNIDNQIFKNSEFINSSLDTDFDYQTPFIDSLLTIEEIQNNILNFRQKNINHPQIAKNELKIIEEQLKGISLNEKPRPLLNYVQIDYSGPHDDLIQKKLNLSLGINIFTPKGSDLELQQNLIELKMLEYEKQLIQESISRKKNTQYKDLQLSIVNYYENLKTKNKEYKNLRIIVKKLIAIGSISPLDLLHLEQNEILSNIKLLESQEELYLSYISFLKTFGVLDSKLTPNLLVSKKLIPKQKR